MNCPVCDGVRMREVEKDDVLIDVCPNCKGVWLDRGELEKIMQGVREIRQEFGRWYDNNYETQHKDDGKRHDRDRDPKYSAPAGYGQQGHGYPGGQGYYPKHKKKKTVIDVLGDLFD